MLIYAEFLGEQRLFADQAKIALETLAIYEHLDCPEGPKKKHQGECKKIVEEASRKSNPPKKASD